MAQWDKMVFKLLRSHTSCDSISPLSALCACL